MQIERNCRATLMRPLPCKVLVCARAKQLKQLHNSDPSYFSPAIFAEPSPGTPSPRSQATVAAAAAAKRQCAPRREGAVLRNAARPGQAYRRATQFANDPRATACLPVGFGASKQNQAEPRARRRESRRRSAHAGRVRRNAKPAEGCFTSRRRRRRESPDSA
jgi:hypothetical protein